MMEERERLTSLKGQFNLAIAEQAANEVVNSLSPYCNKIAVCGSIRRKRLTVGDIDIIVAVLHQPGFLNTLSYLQNAPSTLGTKFTFVYKGISVDILVVNELAWGAALMHSTGPVSENIRLRAIAKRKGMLLSQYGLFSRSTGKLVAGATEKGVYLALGVPFVEPERRDSNG